MNIKNLLIMSIYISLFLTGCSYKTSEESVDMSTYYKNKNSIHSNASFQESDYQKYKNYKQQQLSKNHSKSSIFDEFTNTNYVTKKTALNNELFDFYSKWEGVRYKLGGESKKGIDCSAFTQRVYKDKFGIELPRTTVTQVNMGVEVKKAELIPGDLVFFKTSKTDKHVGVYVGNGNFMHASIKGIQYTSLDKPFYKKNYWTSRRIIN